MTVTSHSRELINQTMDIAMKNAAFMLLTLLLIMPATPADSAELFPEDPGWPRLISAHGKELTIYQPQVDYWTDYKILHFRCALSLKTSKNSPEKFGVAEIDADTVVDHGSRVVAVLPKSRSIRFPNTSESEENTLRKEVEKLYPSGKALTISLDRVIAYLDPEKQPQQQAVELNLDPPKIFYSTKPAILVLYFGQPELQPVVKDRNELMFAVNCNWPVFFTTTDQRYYLLNGDNWLTSKDALRGPWTVAGSLPESLSSLPDDENWEDVRKQIPGKRLSGAPVVFVDTEPAELLLTQGEPTYSPIAGTKLMRVANTDSAVFLHSAEKKYYFLTAGRWFSASGLNGPWSAASTQLPADFARIPDNDPSAFVKTSVPGTVEAKDAVLLASIPTKSEVSLAAPPSVQVIYEGPPKFVSIESTTIQYAVNSPNSVFLVTGSYYCCYNGIWFTSPSPSGPWMLCANVPTVIYTIPPSHPMHNVTYVVVQSSTPTTVVYTQPAGYSGEYVAKTGVLMFGAGMVVGALIADSHHHHYPPYPVHYSYGWGARYDYRHGGYYRAGHAAYGPYAGGGAGKAYNPRTGTYSRAAYSYGPSGSASTRQAYNPYSGARSSSTRVDTDHGSAGRGRAYNPSTGNAVRGGYRTDDRGSAAAIQTNRGTGARAVESESGAGAASWNTKYSQGVARRDQEGNVYAAKDGSVYKKDTSGNWSTNNGSGWQSTSAPQTTRELNAQATARTRGSQMQARAGAR